MHARLCMYAYMYQHQACLHLRERYVSAAGKQYSCMLNTGIRTSETAATAASTTAASTAATTAVTINTSWQRPLWRPHVRHQAACTFAAHPAIECCKHRHPACRVARSRLVEGLGRCWRVAGTTWQRLEQQLPRRGALYFVLAYIEEEDHKEDL